MDKIIRIRVSVVLIQDGKILLVKQKKFGKEYWLVPGGGLHFGETIKDAAKREAKEETNLDIELKQLLFLWESINPDGSKHVVNLFFLGEILGGQLKLAEEPNLIDLKFFDFNDLKDLKFYPPITQQLLAVKNNNFNCLPDIFPSFWAE